MDEEKREEEERGRKKTMNKLLILRGHKPDSSGFYISFLPLNKKKKKNGIYYFCVN